MGYRETAPSAGLRPLVEAAWSADDGDEAVRVLPDGCMDLIEMDGRLVVAGPDTCALIAARGRNPMLGLRFRPGVLPRLLGVPAAELVGLRVPLDDFCTVESRTVIDVAYELAARPVRRDTAPWSLDGLHHFTAALSTATPVARVARETGWSDRTLQRQCNAVYGYGPATLRRVLRFRRAVSLLRSGRALADVAVVAGYADQPHLHREVRAFAGTTATSLATA